MSRASTAVRAVTGLVLAGGLAALVSAGGAIDIPGQVAAETAVRTIQVPAGASTLVCAGAPAVADAGVDVDDEFAQEAADSEATLQAVTFPREARPPALAQLRPMGGSATPLDRAGDLGVAHGSNELDPSVLTVKPFAVEAGLATGASIWRAESGDLRSVSASACQAPASDLWVVGGSGELGHSSTLTIANPALTPATVSVELHGPLGRIDTPLLTGLVVAPGSSLSVLLEAHAADVSALAAHVTSSGADVVATIAHSAVDGITPRGFDIATPSAAPTTQLLIPGVALTASLTDQGASSPSATSPGSAVRIVNPSDEVAIMSLVLVGPDGETAIPGADAVTISPGAVFEVSLGGLPEGDFAVRIDSDSAVTAAAVLQRGDAERDLTWVPAVAPVTHAVGAVGGMARLVVTAREDSEITVRTWDASGAALDERVIHAAAGTTVDVNGAGVAAVELASSAPVVAAAVYEELDGALLSVMPLTADANEQHAVDVLVLN